MRTIFTTEELGVTPRIPVLDRGGPLLVHHPDRWLGSPPDWRRQLCEARAFAGSVPAFNGFDWHRQSPVNSRSQFKVADGPAAPDESASRRPQIYMERLPLAVLCSTTGVPQNLDGSFAIAFL